MHFGSIASGIEAASVAFTPLGWHAAWFSEIEPFPSAVLRHHYPAVPNFGDMRGLPALIRFGLIEAPDVLCGGTPCQAFSVAGQRRSLDDDRGNLTLTYCEIANAIDDARARAGLPPAIDFWENVPGVLSTADNAFGCFLGELAGAGSALDPEPRPAAGKSSRYWRWVKESGQHAPSWPDAGCVLGPRRAIAWRVLDAQYFGLAQRRRRVFVVASAREGFDPAAVLLEFDGVRRDLAPSRETRQEVAGTIEASLGRSRGAGTPVGTLTSNPKGDNAGQESKLVTVGPLMAAHGPRGHGGSGIATQQGAESGHLIPVCITGDITHTLKAEGFDASEDGTGRGQPIVAFGGNNTSGPIDAAAALNANRGCHNPGDFEAGTLLVQPLPFDTTQITSATNRCRPQHGDPCHPLAAGAHPPAIAFHPTQTPITSDDGTTHCLGTGSSGGTATVAVAYTTKLHNTQSNNAGKLFEERTPALDANSPAPALLRSAQVRRLMPLECERLQGFPDGYTAIPWDGWRKMDASETPESCTAEGLEVRQSPKTGKWSVRDADGPRYKALGNSWPIPVVAWIGARIDAEARRIQ